MLNLTYKYYHKQASEEVFLVLHGGGPNGVESPFISKIITSIADSKHSVFAFNFPYCERGEERASGAGLTEEIDALNTIINFLRQEGYRKITIIAKSLGSVITSFWLAQNPNETIDVVILGYVIGSVKTASIADNLRVVFQGENDRFGGALLLKQELDTEKSDAKIIEIKNADHSYRDANGNPIYQDLVIEKLLAWIEGGDDE
jgi:predicted alpha/beta-hydrolase family hydrolase